VASLGLRQGRDRPFHICPASPNQHSFSFSFCVPTTRTSPYSFILACSPRPAAASLPNSYCAALATILDALMVMAEKRAGFSLILSGRKLAIPAAYAPSAYLQYIRAYCAVLFSSHNIDKAHLLVKGGEMHCLPRVFPNRGHMPEKPNHSSICKTSSYTKDFYAQVSLVIQYEPPSALPSHTAAVA
jgi:hypothetical protein